jgi:glyoxylase-like metal-dependent hydrolase (beta-lactamase superfamily II)
MVIQWGVTFSVRRLDLGYALIPDGVPGGPRVAGVLAYLVRHGDEFLLFDTGLGSEPEVDEVYRPQRRDLSAALADAGVRLADVTLVVNCHLHFDHCGGNPSLAGRPIVVQRAELAAARGPEYTMPWLVDFDGARYEPLDPEAELRPGLWVIPTPGHTDGHQSLVVRQPDGTVVLAGQLTDTASAFTDAALARRAARDGLAAPLPPFPDWLDRLLAFDPRRVVFAHDAAEWSPH